MSRKVGIGLERSAVEKANHARVWDVQVNHHYKTRLLQLGFLTPTSEKIQTLLTWKTTSRSGQTVKEYRTGRSQWIRSQWQ